MSGVDYPLPHDRSLTLSFKFQMYWWTLTINRPFLINTWFDHFAASVEYFSSGDFFFGGAVMIVRVAAIFVGLALEALVVWLYFLSAKDSHYLAVFGLASALAAPLGLSAIGYAVVGYRASVISELAKVPEIGRLIEQAKTQQERVRLLEMERAKLEEIIKLESRRQSIKDRTQSLESDAVRIFEELKSLDAELDLLGEKIGQSPVSDEIKKLRERVEGRDRGDVYFTVGGKVVRIDRDIVKGMPFGFGNITLAYFKIFQRVIEYWRSRN